VSEGELSHLGPDGSARMVDVGEKAEGERMARARAVVRMSEETARAVDAGDGPKGDVVGPARIAGIAAAKRTGELIPLAHPLPLTFADVEIEIEPGKGIVRIEAEARVVGRTGVEMEAMTACSVAALTIYDMVKGLERGTKIESIELIEKLGGRSGHWRSEDPAR
jgi:cyclic pyranopterin monophosphate synthase